MGFLVPGFLVGLVFAGVPFLLHLIYRRRAPRVVFAATRFLRTAAERTSRRRRIENLLLLVLRTLMVALLAVGLAGPVLKRAVGSGRSGSDVVIVMDNSASMGARDDSGDRFSRAKEALDEMLSRLESGDMVALIPTAGGGKTGEGAFTADISGVREQAARLVTSAARGSVAAALGRAGELFSESAASNKLLYVISDLQAKSFTGEEALSDEARDALLGVPVVVYDCGSGVVRNISVEGLQATGRGGVVGTPMEITARISSNSPVDENVAVSLVVGGRRVGQRTIVLAPGGSGDISFSTVAESPGALSGFVEVEAADGLAADDRRHFSCLVRERVKALLLRREHREPAFDDDVFFLWRALDPFGGGASAARSAFDVSVATYEEPQELASYDVVFLMLRQGLDEEMAGGILAYVEGGGNLVVMACDEDALAGFDAAWMPGRLVGMKMAGRGEGESFSIADLEFAGGALSAFEEEPPALYNTVLVYAYWLTDPSPDARVLARFDTADAAIVEGEVGAGRAILFSLAPLGRMTNLASSKFFLPLLHELSFHLVRAGGGPGEVYAGDMVRLLPAGQGGEGLVVKSPDGASVHVKAREGAPLMYESTEMPGCYTIRKPDESSESGAFSVNLDPAELDLRRLEDQAREGWLPGREMIVVRSADEIAAALGSLEGVLALGDLLLYGVLAVALFECMAANRLPGKSSRSR